MSRCRLTQLLSKLNLNIVPFLIFTRKFNYQKATSRYMLVQSIVSDEATSDVLERMSGVLFANKRNFPFGNMPHDKKFETG